MKEFRITPENRAQVYRALWHGWVEDNRVYEAVSRIGYITWKGIDTDLLLDYLCSYLDFDNGDYYFSGKSEYRSVADFIVSTYEDLTQEQVDILLSFTSDLGAMVDCLTFLDIDKEVSEARQRAVQKFQCLNDLKSVENRAGIIEAGKSDISYRALILLKSYMKYWDIDFECPQDEIFQDVQDEWWIGWWMYKDRYVSNITKECALAVIKKFSELGELGNIVLDQINCEVGFAPYCYDEEDEDGEGILFTKYKKEVLGAWGCMLGYYFGFINGAWHLSRNDSRVAHGRTEYECRRQRVDANRIHITLYNMPDSEVDLTEEDFLIAVKQNGNAIAYVPDPSDEVKLAAVRTNGEAIRFIDNPTEEMCLEAVKQNGLAIRYLPENITSNADAHYVQELQKSAVQNSSNAINFISKPSSAIVSIAICDCDYIDEDYLGDDEEEIIVTLSKNPKLIRSVSEPTGKELLTVVQMDGRNIQYIKSPSREICLAAIRQNPDAINFIENPTQEMKDLADKVRNGEQFSEMEYNDNENLVGSNELGHAQVELLNWCLGNLRRMLYSLNSSKESKTRLYESNNIIYVESGVVKIKMSCDGENFSIQGVKLSKDNKEKAYMFVYKTIERLVEKVALPIKSVTFTSGLADFSSGELVKSTEEGSVEIILK